MLLKALIHFSVFALVSTSQVFWKRQGRYDIRHDGRYTFVNCGKEDAASLASLIHSLRAMLRPSLYDVSFSKPSPAFMTFFGSARNVPYVEKVLLNVTTGVSLYPPARRFHQTGSPLLICATAGGQIIANRDQKDYYYECVLDPFKALIAISGTPYIVICPYFFLTKALDSPPAHNCLTMDSSINRFLGTGSDFLNFKVLALLDGILRYYLSATTRLSDNLVTDVDSCVRLGARQKVENPSNYVYYVASVLGRCEDFPDLPVPRRRPLENTTILALTDSDDRGTNATTLTNLPVSSPLVLVDLSGSLHT